VVAQGLELELVRGLELAEVLAQEQELVRGLELARVLEALKQGPLLP